MTWADTTFTIAAILGSVPPAPRPSRTPSTKSPLSASNICPAPVDCPTEIRASLVRRITSPSASLALTTAAMFSPVISVLMGSATRRASNPKLNMDATIDVARSRFPIDKPPSIFSAILTIIVPNGFRFAILRTPGCMTAAIIGKSGRLPVTRSNPSDTLAISGNSSSFARIVIV